MDKAQMDAKKKLNDCYFYYYSECTKGDTCQFRHEPLALGCEVTCYNWQLANCFDYQCKYRHMELKKNRKQIPCYWETQPTGCLKKHCPFMHKQADRNKDKDQEQLPQQVVGQPMPVVNQEQGLAIHNMPAVPNAAAAPAMAHPTFQRPSRRPVVMDPTKMVSVPPAVLAAHQNRRPTHDPLLVNLEEESDSESQPSLTPVKNRLLDDSKRVITIKSLEQIRLERIQEEAAAFYPCYQNIPEITIRTNFGMSNDDDTYVTVDNRQREKYASMSLDEIQGETRKAPKRPSTESSDFKILTLDEIRAKKRKTSIVADKVPNSNIQVVDDKALEACLKIIKEKTTLKPRKRCCKVLNLNNIPKKPKLIRNRLAQPKPNDDVEENSLLSSNSDGILDSLTDEEFSESELLQENVPDVIASCVNNGSGKPSTSKFANIKDMELEDEEFLKTLEEFLDE